MSHPSPKEEGAPSRFAMIVGYGVFLWVLFEVAARLIIPIVHGISDAPIRLSPRDQSLLESLLDRSTKYIVFDSALGWAIRPETKVGLYQSNRLGARSMREYTPEKPATGIHRILAFGDSFTHCDDVATEDAWPTLMESMHPDLEVPNFGVPAYGLDQALLRFNQVSREVRADTVLMGMMSENVYRHINTFRKFYQRGEGFPLGKPRFIEDGSDSLRLIPSGFKSLDDYRLLLKDTENTLKRVGEFDYFFNHKVPADDCGLMKSPCALGAATWLVRDRIDKGQKDPLSGFLHYDMASEGPRLTVKLVHEFAAAVTQQKMRPILVLFPNKTDVLQFRFTRTRNYAPMLEASRQLGIEAWDAMDAFLEGQQLLPYDSLFESSSGHYSPEGNRRIAHWLSGQLKPSAAAPLQSRSRPDGLHVASDG